MLHRMSSQRGISQRWRIVLYGVAMTCRALALLALVGAACAQSAPNQPSLSDKQVKKNDCKAGADGAETGPVAISGPWKRKGCAQLRVVFCGKSCNTTGAHQLHHQRRRASVAAAAVLRSSAAASVCWLLPLLPLLLLAALLTLGAVFTKVSGTVAADNALPTIVNLLKSTDFNSPKKCVGTNGAPCSSFDLSVDEYSVMRVDDSKYDAAKKTVNGRVLDSGPSALGSRFYVEAGMYGTEGKYWVRSPTRVLTKGTNMVHAFYLIVGLIDGQPRLMRWESTGQLGGCVKGTTNVQQDFSSNADATCSPACPDAKKNADKTKASKSGCGTQLDQTMTCNQDDCGQPVNNKLPLQIYVTWAGTDSDKRPLTSKGLSYKNFRKYSTAKLVEAGAEQAKEAANKVQKCVTANCGKGP